MAPNLYGERNTHACLVRVTKKKKNSDPHEAGVSKVSIRSTYSILSLRLPTLHKGERDDTNEGRRFVLSEPDVYFMSGNKYPRWHGSLGCGCAW